MKKSVFLGMSAALAVVLGPLRADADVTEWFRTPEALLADATCVSDTNAFTCGSAPISCAHDGVIYAPYLTARSGHGEQHKIIALSVFPADRPGEARNHVIAEAGVLGPAADCTQVIDPFAVWHDDRVRVYFLANAEYYRLCDWDPVTHAVVTTQPVRCTWAGAATNELTSVPLAAYLTAQGCTNFNLKADASEHLICTAKPAWHGGAFYGTVTSGSSQPVVFRCADGETFEFVGVVPVIGQYECQVAWLGDTLYALVRAAAGGRNFWTSDDGGATWTYRKSIAMAETRPQLLAWRDKLLVGYSENDVATNLIRQGRNNMRLKAGTGTDFDAFEQAFRVIDPIGFVYYDLVPSGDDLYCLWSNSSVYPDLGGTLSGKDAVFAARLSVSTNDDANVSWCTVGVNLEVTVRAGAVGSGGGRLVIAWGAADGGETPATWDHTVDVGEVTPTGGVWKLRPATLGVPDSCRLRVYAVDRYELLASIGSSGTQYLDTGLCHVQTDVVDLDLQMDTFNASVNSEIYGARDDGSGVTSVEAFSGFDGSKNALTIADFCNQGSSRVKVVHGTTFDAIAGKRLKIRLAAAGSSIRTDDGTVDATGGAYSGTFSLTHTAWVFGLNGAGWARHPGMTLYALDVSRGGSPLRRYRPVRFSNGAIGLRDQLTGQQLTNAGTGAFAAGAVTNSVTDITTYLARSAAGDWKADYNRIVAKLTDSAGPFDGAAHALGLSVLYPADGEGCTVRWAWNGAPEEGDFTHEGPCAYVAPGVYTNVVRVTDVQGQMTPYVATGVVSIAARSVMVASGSGVIGLVVDPAVLTVTNAALLLAWDTADRGESIADWPSRTTVVARLDATGGTFRVDAASLGLADGDICRAFVMPTHPLLAYLGSTGTQYLDTGVKHLNTDVVTLDLLQTASVEKKSGAVNAMIYGARDDNDGGLAVEVFQGYAGGTGAATTYGDFRGAVDAACRMIATMGDTFDAYFNRRFTVRLDASGPRLAFADGGYSARSTAGYAASFALSASAYVFSVNGAGWSTHPGLRVYDLSIVRDGEPLRHFVPARTADDDPGLLDLVTGDFRANLGTGEFACGEVTNYLPQTSQPAGYSLATSVSLGGEACQGAVTDWTGDYDGLAHAATLRVLYPSTGSVVRWAWKASPGDGDFTHAGPRAYVAPGVYTNVVRIADADGALAPWTGTGVVTIVRLPVMTAAVGPTLVADVAPGVATEGDALFLAWDGDDAGSAKLADWAHYGVVGALSAEGGVYVVTAATWRQMGVPEGAACRFFAMPAYEALEYAASSSSAQYVDLGHEMKSSYTADVEAEVPSDMAVSGAFGIFGARTSHVEANFSVGADQNCAYADNNDCDQDSSRQYYQAKATPLVKGQRYRFHVGRPCSVSGAASAKAARSWTDDFTTTATAWAFGINHEGSPAFTSSSGFRIYSCVVSNAVPSMIVDARPARDADGAVCLYEAVSDVFLPNAGTGSLSAGPSLGLRPRLKASLRAVSLPLVARHPAGFSFSVW